jgi:hypothetical protein
MAQLRRFGRKISLPSTRQILHELKVFSGQEDARKACAVMIGLAETATWQEIQACRLHSEFADKQAV